MYTETLSVSFYFLFVPFPYHEWIVRVLVKSHHEYAGDS